MGVKLSSIMGVKLSSIINKMDKFLRYRNI